MDKVKIEPGAAFLYPMPMVLVGAVVGAQVNFMAVGWVARVNFKPPLFAVALGGHFTNKGIDEHRQFSINIPGADLMPKVDYCGLVTGSRSDKSGLFEVFYGELDKAPLIGECPVAMACTLVERVALPSNTLYIGEPREVFTEARYMTEGRLDIRKMDPFTLTMPDNGYWSVGRRIGDAWSAGKALKKKNPG